MIRSDAAWAKRDWPYYAAILVFSCWPAANFVSANIDLAVNFVAVFVVDLCVFLVAAIVFFVLCRAFPAPGKPRLASLTCAGLAVFFAVQLVNIALAKLGLSISVMGTWAVGSLLIMGAVWFVARGAKGFLVVSTFGAVALLFAVVSAVSQVATLSYAPRVENNVPVAEASSTKRPNVYYILVDGYPRTDTLAKYASVDNTEFLKGLSESGFRILKNARSNYFITDLSIPSLLSMDYIPQNGSGSALKKQDLLRIMQGTNSVYDAMRRLGYRIVVHGTRLCSDLVDKCLENNLGLPRDAWQFLRTTPIPVLVSHISPALYGTITRARDLRMDEITDRIERLDAAPVLVIVHSFEIHSSVYKPDCSYRKTAGSDDLKRVLEFDQMLKTAKDYAEGFPCVHRMLTRLVHSLVRRDPGAIVVITADHGSSFTLDQGPQSPTFVNERSAILSAWRLPARCHGLIGDSLSVVNFFRVILSCVENRPMNMLENRIYAGIAIDDFKRVPLP